jgi:MFS transporter, DHA1 family, inner membrane transport protein
MSIFSVGDVGPTADAKTVAASLPSAVQGLPWPTLIALGAATLVMVTTEMLPTAVLGPMSRGLDVPDARIAQLVSLWAAVVVFTSFPSVRLTRRWNRRTVIVHGLLGVSLSSALTAAAPSYTTALGARLIGAVAVGLLWSTINAHVADVVEDRLLGPAISVVLAGATFGMVLGTPLARSIADGVGWRAPFAILAGGGFVVAGLVQLVVIPGSATRWTPGTGNDGHASVSAWRMTAATGLVGVVFAGHYGAFTFITRLVEVPAAGLPGGMSTLLLVFGLASALGVATAGRVHEHTALALVSAAALTAAAILGLAVANSGIAIGVALVVAWGVLTGALNPLAQTEIFRLAGPEQRSTAGALIPVLFNGGIAVGAATAGAAVEHMGVGALPGLASAVVGLGAVGLAALFRLS